MQLQSADAGQPLLAKVMVCVTEDWFCLSHFQPLLRRLARLAHEVVVVTRSSGRMGEIEALGARTIELEYNRSSMNPLREARTVRHLVEILKAERPTAVHLIAMKPIVLGGIALEIARAPHTVVHMTGLGFLAISDTAKARTARRLALAIMRRTLSRPSSWLLYENPEDRQFLKEGGVIAGARATMLGGAGIDPEAFPAGPATGNDPPIAAFVGRMIRSKGVGVLLEAGRLLEARGVPLAIELYGDTDDGNPEAIGTADLKNWDNGRDRRFLGPTRDVAAVWRRADIFVLPALSREGMPRALLEAASSARAAIVSDVPGCRFFVRDGVEGLIVPPGAPPALAEALARLAQDPSLRQRLGAAARAKVLGGYTEAAVQDGIESAYRAMTTKGFRSV